MNLNYCQTAIACNVRRCSTTMQHPSVPHLVKQGDAASPTLSLSLSQLSHLAPCVGESNGIRLAKNLEQEAMSTVHGQWSNVHGKWSRANGQRSSVSGAWSTVQGQWSRLNDQFSIVSDEWKNPGWGLRWSGSPFLTMILDTVNATSSMHICLSIFH